MKQKTIRVLAAIAVALAAIACASPAWAYFTDNDQGTGGFTIPIVPDTEIDEPPVVEGQKVIRIRNTGTELEGDSEVPVMVRAKVYFGDNAKATVTLGEGWSGPTNPTGDGDIYEYSEVVPVDGTTTDLIVKVELPSAASETSPEGAELGDNFRVIVLYEATPYINYDADGTPHAVWTSNE